MVHAEHNPRWHCGKFLHGATTFGAVKLRSRKPWQWACAAKPLTSKPDNGVALEEGLSHALKTLPPIATLKTPWGGPPSYALSARRPMLGTTTSSSGWPRPSEADWFQGGMLPLKFGKSDSFARLVIGLPGPAGGGKGATHEAA